MKIGVICAPGMGDALILHIASHQLTLAGHEVTTFTPHRFGSWLKTSSFQSLGNPASLLLFDALFLQHDNTALSKTIHALPLPVYTFYGSHQPRKHGPLRPGFDYVCNPDQTMVENVVTSLQTLFQISATKDNGFTPPQGLIHRHFKKRVAIHASSSSPDKNWPHFQKVANWLTNQGYEPCLLPHFPTLEALASFIYESGFFLGNDSGPGHIASCLHIPHLIIGKEEKQMRFWRPGWTPGEILTPSPWIPNWKRLRLRQTYWKLFISSNRVIKALKNKVLLK